MGIRVRRGRTFEALDAGSSPAVAVVNDAFANRFFPDGNPLGTRVKQGWPEETGTWREIVGVVNDVRVSGLSGDSVLQVYLPVAQVGQQMGAFVARADGDSRALGRAMEASDSRGGPELAHL